MLRTMIPMIALWLMAQPLLAQTDNVARSQAKSQKRQAFQWVNSLRVKVPGLKHATFRSPSMNCDVGYCIYLPPQYEGSNRRFPVVYYLHGGRPGSETKSVRLVPFLHQQFAECNVRPMIYVFVNGGPVSHYNLPGQPDAQGADVFIRELIPHVDATYRTIAHREGRGLEGFSQGGRGTARLMFRYPELFATAAPGGAGQATEKRISENEGRESDTLVFAEGDNTWDLARDYVKRSGPRLQILFQVGTKGFNYQNNLEYMTFMDQLGIPYEKVIVDGAEHSAMQIYLKAGATIMKFHEKGLRHE